MTIYYFFYSFIFFVKQVFTKKHYQIIFYAPQHFNRGKNNENIFLKDSVKVKKLIEQFSL